MRLLIIDDEASIRKTTAVLLEGMGHQTVAVETGAAALQQLDKAHFEAAFLDLKLDGESGLELLPRLLESSPELDVVVFTAYASIETAVEAMRRGASDYVPKPFTPEQIRKVLARVLRARRLEHRLADLETRLSTDSPAPDLATAEPGVAKVFEIALKAAATPATILILGESGTGKTVLARAIHEASPLKENPFVTVSCPSLSRELLESELFGHVKGAYTGAVSDTWGKAAQAEGGTLFLDEIGELPLEIQPKLLRLLQEKEYDRLGESKPRRANVRVIAASNRNLEEAVKEGRCREDLFYRLNVITLTLPPLRERRADLATLAAGYLRFFCRQCGKRLHGFSEEAGQALQRYSWPGNLRELRNVVERAVILAGGSQIDLPDLPDQLRLASAPSQAARLEVGALVSLEELEKEHIRLILARAATQEEAARVLGIDPATLYRKRKKLFSPEADPRRMNAPAPRAPGLLRTRLFLNLVPLVVMLLALGLYAIVLFFWLATSVNVAAMRHYQSVAAAQAMSLAQVRMQGGVLMVFEQKLELGRDFFAQNRQLFAQNLAVQQTNISSAEEKELSRQLTTNYQAFAEAGERIFSSHQPEEQRQVYAERLYPALSIGTGLIENISRLHRDAILAAHTNALSASRRATLLMLIGLVAALAVASYACYQVSRSILQPIQSLTRATRELGEGRLDPRVPVASIRELDELAAAFNNMAAQLRVYRQSTTEELVRLHRTMETTLASFPDPIFVLNPAGRIELMNPAAQNLAAALDLKGELPGRLPATARKVLDSGQSFLPDSFQEVISFRLGGQEKSFLPRIVAMRGQEGVQLGIAVVLYDVTRFRLLDDAKTNLVGTVSHEIKTPLTGLRLALHLLLENTTGELNARQSELVLTARDDAERMLRTLNNLLDLARLDAGNGELDQQEVTPEALVAGTMKEMVEVVSAKGLRLVSSLDPGLPLVRVDPQRLSHVFANLVSNAVKHSPAGGEIALRARRTESGDVQFSVLDEGPGVPEEYKARVFDRFFRVPGQKKTGAGLGLSIAREIVIAHGGRIGVRSRSGRGSEFYFTLPASQRRSV